ncbi:DUF1289 domain-containing protein [Sphingosinicellaceae bacterium]|nr:DUF1289 domain-containing protein [Sphingosinicellaceae bacterium]
MIESPCTKVCEIVAGSGQGADAVDLCRGCGRTLDEIGRWSTTTEADRARIVAALPDRLIRSQAA